MNLQLLSLILRALGAAATLKEVFDGKAEKLAPYLNTLASFAELPEETRAEQEALLAQVEAWIEEKRPPTDAELDAFKAVRDDLDAKLRAARASIPE